ncbi:MAG: helix-turn-helix transcriptional regulator [Phycisphaerae bacterium]|nr:helix-turn-helix transcriptional regulator [Phycisphaerae bacterium]
MAKTWVDIMTETPEDKHLFEQERAILEVTELIWQLMEEQDVSKAELARKMGTSKANMTQMLDGRRNMTIRTISDLLFHLNHTFGMKACKVGEDINTRFKQMDQVKPQKVAGSFQVNCRPFRWQSANKNTLEPQSHYPDVKLKIAS